jgi:hypothetical protein
MVPAHFMVGLLSRYLLGVIEENHLREDIIVTRYNVTNRVKFIHNLTTQVFRNLY